jgi:hypothetical protein
MRTEREIRDELNGVFAMNELFLHSLVVAYASVSVIAFIALMHKRD